MTHRPLLTLLAALALSACGGGSPEKTNTGVVGDTDGDGVADDFDACPGFPDTADADADGTADGCDPCPDTSETDDDGDGQCGDDDPCPADNPDDTDGDSICDSDDLCPLDADPGHDEDNDGVCNADDLCPGFNDAGDVDGDLVPNGCDVCPFDILDDSDGDGRCDTDDRCEGFDDNLDGDGDNQPDDCDPCPTDNPNDTDGDGVCNSVDLCPLDNPDDTDGDGVCDSDDICRLGDDNVNDDGDQYPDACDPCPGDGANTCIGPGDHLTVPFYPPDSTGQWCYGDALLYFEYFGELTWDECEVILNSTGTQPYVGQYTMYPAGWIGDQDAGNAVIADPGGNWPVEMVVPRTDLHSCQVAVFDPRTAPTNFPVEQIYFDATTGRTWHYWDMTQQTHSQAIAFADTLGARIINPNVVGLVGLPRMTAPTHWCHAGAEFNGGSNCNSDQICDFMVGYFE